MEMRPEHNVAMSTQPSGVMPLQMRPSPDAMVNRPELWPVCSRCKLPVTQFSLSDRLRCDLMSLLAKKQTNDAVRLLQLVAACPRTYAVSWVTHHGLNCFCNPACPQCRRPLRTPKAQQCRFCGSNWHAQSSAEQVPPEQQATTRH